MGEDRLDEVLRPRPAGVYLSVGEARPGKASTGHYRRNVHGAVRNSRLGVITDSNVVYGPWLEMGRSNRPTRFKGYAAFRRTGDWLNKRAKQVLNAHISVWTRRVS